MNTRLIQTCDLEYHPNYTPPLAEPLALFAYIHSEMRQPAAIPPLLVRFDSVRKKFQVIEDEATEQRHSLLLEAARKLGLSSVPCRIVDEDAPPAEESASPPSEPPPPLFSADRQTPWIGAAGLGASHFNALFRDLLTAFSHMAGGRRRKTLRSALRVADEDDWQQEAFLALWGELNREEPRLLSASEVSQFAFGVFRNQAMRAMKRGSRTVPFQEERLKNGILVPDPLLAAEETHCLEEAVQALKGLIERTEKTLHTELARLSARRRRAVRAWLAGASFRRATLATGVSLAVLRRLTDQFRFEQSRLSLLLGEVRRDLKALYLDWPEAAARIWPWRLA